MKFTNMQMSQVRLIAVLGALSAFGPVTTDLYLPALPQAAHTLGVTTSGIQSSLTACLLGLAIGQLLIGPMSDAWGRRRPMLAGMAVFTVASLLCAVAGNVLVLDLLRLFQGLAGAAGIVISFAVIRDLYEGTAASKAYSFLLAVNGIAPILAPVIGAQLLRVMNWRGLFVVLAGLGLIFLALAYLWVPETLAPQRRHGGGAAAVWAGLRAAVTDRRFVGYVLVVALSFAAMVAYISASSFVFQQVYGVSPQLFSVFFALNGAGILLANGINVRLLNRRSPRLLLDAGLWGLGLGAVTVLVVVSLPGLSVWWLVPPLWVMVSSLGFVLPNATALALDEHGDSAGSAAAILGCQQFLAGAIVAPLVGVGGTSAIPMGIVAAAASALAIVARLTLARSPRPAAVADDSLAQWIN
ncbi:DHA1 family bicyclomycin/chloramphenicol resistance-like MFS transporter [Rhodococcus sp. OK611]|jgi:MFS transporter, DHA1 family, multidrug resistance protein|uniref:multidrug effflux MFS transporter n=1 Tax=unclassified Rhodococcus (in: high G+C Gram-positive bacteria) TaxID=192944 RepID=UPI000BDB2E6F|nr:MULTISPECIES: multidrug effflux MFS transporter [unclassified Rhodococcus (in: high G+C Gram-positive bacteria)]PTR39015.1 DHA1 family bicyclomycin/chloramphenicol resistance-like MFS transporter [Rhodococcus sp. OK611]SNX92801.1 MFS transporter, DHA1 family, bicyclomycin/chloramphenicol resistance protein [Rhodococcus sp. OK270]